MASRRKTCGARLSLFDWTGTTTTGDPLYPHLINSVPFTQITARANENRDALRFKTGAILLLLRLQPGQLACSGSRLCIPHFFVRDLWHMRDFRLKLKAAGFEHELLMLNRSSEVGL